MMPHWIFLTTNQAEIDVFENISLLYFFNFFFSFSIFFLNFFNQINLGLYIWVSFEITYLFLLSFFFFILLK